MGVTNAKKFLTAEHPDGLALEDTFVSPALADQVIYTSSAVNSHQVL
jgi:hypothetical protein